MSNIIWIKKKLLIVICLVFVLLGYTNFGQNNISSFGKLRISHTNPHLLETTHGVPVFLNNYTVWKLIKNGTREDIARLITSLKEHKFNAISFVLLNESFMNDFDGSQFTVVNDTLIYGKSSLLYALNGNFDLSKSDITIGNNSLHHREYDFWDHVDYTINLAAENEMYVCINPTWGNWVSGGYGGPEPTSLIIFDKKNAYAYGVWLGKRYGNKNNIIWMLGGDRSAVYKVKDSLYDYRMVWNAMAEGLADGINRFSKQDGRADYSNLLISYHPRKWAPNSSEWFHNESWLSFNSIQDAPYDQVVSLSHDYHLKPVKPVWLFEGRYEGATTPWAIRYQAYQTVLNGGFGHTYGNDNWNFSPNWDQYIDLPGLRQMEHLFTVCRGIWTDNQFFNRIPDPELIVGSCGDTKGDGMTVMDSCGGYDTGKKGNAISNRITAMRGNDGSWALVYTANGRNITLDLTRLKLEKQDAFWFNPRNGTWFANGKEHRYPVPFIKKLKSGSGTFTFDPPHDTCPYNDWVLVLK